MRDLLAHWSLVEADLHQSYGVDLEDFSLLQSRTWRWLRERIGALLGDPNTRTWRVLVRPQLDKQ